MQDLTPDAIDALSGHASTRFRLIDVRSSSDRAIRPPPPWVEPISLDELGQRAAEQFSHDADLIVLGTDDEETAAAEEILLRHGFTNVHAYRGGFDLFARTFSWRY